MKTTWLQRVLWRVIVLVPVSFASAEEARLTPKEVVTVFAETYEKEIQEVVQSKDLPITDAYKDLFEAVKDLFNAVKALDWPKTESAFKALRVKSGQYEASEFDPAVAAELGQYVLEPYGIFEQVHLWTPSLLEMYAEDIMREIPSNAVYFGGTDPGRFVISAYQTVYKKPFYVLTQNALCAGPYMSYARTRLGEHIWLPSKEEVSQSFANFVNDVQSGRIPSEGVSVKNGKVQLNGVGTMGLNGYISKAIFDQNKTNHPFYVEESYVLPWMYPYLEPAGLIMKINTEPITLTDEMIAKDRQYWDQYLERLLCHPDYKNDETAKKTFSKLRAAIAGLYFARGKTDEAEYAFKQAIELDPENQNTRGFLDKIKKMKEKKPAKDPTSSATTSKANGSSLPKEMNEHLKKLTYDTKNGWVKTGVILKQNQKVKLKAKGKWFPSIKNELEATADGVSKEEWRQYSIVSNIPHGRLIAYIDGADTEYYELGSQAYFKAKTNGELVIGVNDKDAKNNSGTLEIKIEY